MNLQLPTGLSRTDIPYRHGRGHTMLLIVLLIPIRSNGSYTEYED